MWHFWIDRGGTFTDIVACTPDGELLSHKLLSEDRTRYRDAAVHGVRELLGVGPKADIKKDTIDSVRMGTTVATNALLERTGDAVVFVTTAGFGDLGEIGTQNRPRLFDLRINRPAPLQAATVEVNERVGPHGEVVAALDEADARKKLARVYAAGVRTVAITLMHGYHNPIHEQNLADICRDIGFDFVATSHDVSPLMKMIPRGQTTVADAYLSPLLGRYVHDLAAALGVDRGACRSLSFMQSNGGLADAAMFSGKDAIVSGPAGGVVGMARTGQQLGYERLIGFDMGGTSTDVCHFAGALERVQETEIGGVRLAIPMLNIHTVAAGGGSVLHFDGARLRVGPDSAGAHPGPACYRCDGPLTVTDANVRLGRIQPAFFPAVFGEGKNEAIDVDAVYSKFDALAQQVNDAVDADTRRSPEAIAEGFCAIAVDNMANAIKHISVQRGYDVAAYALQCFGGAGGQHACAVADALEMDTVLVHPLAGVLSAYGMGLADVRALAERQIEQVLDGDGARRARELAAWLADGVTADVCRQVEAASAIDTESLVYLRYSGAHQSLAVSLAPLGEMRAAFETAHRARFGFAGHGGTLVIERVTVEAIGRGRAPESRHVAVGKPAAPAERVSMVCNGEWVDTPVFERDVLAAGQVIAGPAIVVDATGTNIIDSGWRATLDKMAVLVIERVRPRQRPPLTDTRVDPIRLEIFNNVFMSIAEQMGATLANTAYSVNIKERFDFSCALFAPDGGLVANAPHVPVHLGSMSAVVRALIDDRGKKLAPGEAYATNVPFKGGTHLPDVTVITPVFDVAGRDVIFFVASRGHHADIGGRTPGSSPPDSTHIDEEGVLIDNVRIVADGELQTGELRELLASGDYPCRNIEQNLADLSAQVAANASGVAGIEHVIEHYGLAGVHAYMGHVQDNAEASVRRVIDRLEDSTFDYELDNQTHIRVAIRVDRENRTATIDFAGTSAQIEGNYNAPLPICRAAVLYVFRTLIDDDIPLNEGCLRPLIIEAPEASIVNCRYPAAVIAGNTEISQSICEALFGALGVLAGSQGTVNNFAYGNSVYQNYETICGGTGAGPDFNGASAVHSHMTNTRLTDPEVLEFRYPVRVEQFCVRRGSGGQGRYHGGDGAIRRLRFLEPATATVLSSHRRLAPFGVAGGCNGARGRNAVERRDGRIEELVGNDQRELDAGDVFVMETPGGGGYGSPPGADD